MDYNHMDLHTQEQSLFTCFFSAGYDIDNLYGPSTMQSCKKKQAVEIIIILYILGGFVIW